MNSRKLTKLTAFMLSVLMMISLCAVGVTASAATDDGDSVAAQGVNVTVKSNFFPEFTKSFDADTDTLTVSYYIQCEKDMLNSQWALTYDPTVLRFNPSKNILDDDDAVCFMPQATDCVSNYNVPDHPEMILGNCTKLSLYKLSTKTGGRVPFVTATFDVIGSGDTTVNLDLEVMQIAKVDSKTHLVDDDTEEDVADNSEIFETSVPIVRESYVYAGEYSDDPYPVEGTTIKFAAPTSTASRYNWTDPVLYYGDTNAMDKLTKLEMTATDDIYYTTDAGANTLISTTGWTVYTLTVTDEQAAAINASKFVGFATADGVNRTTLVSGSNVLKAGVDTYTAKYATTAKTIADLAGKTFVIKDSAYGATSSVSYVGYWVSDYVTVKAAAPLAPTSYSTWYGVDLYYGDSMTFDNLSKVTMINTGETTKVASLSKTMSIKTGRWYIFAITLDSTTAKAVESAKYVGFSKTDAINRTAILKNVLFAKTNTFDGNYNTTARTLADLEGQVFVVQGMTSNSASSVATYTGEWETKDVYTSGNDDTITIYFAAPKGIKDYATWDNGVELYYSNASTYKEAARLEMTKLDETKAVTVDSTKLATLKSGDWDVYSLTLTVEQIKAIDDCQRIGFIEKDSFNRTSYMGYRNICKASKMEGETTYSGFQESIETYDGYMFIISSCYSAQNENVTLTGSWVVK